MMSKDLEDNGVIVASAAQAAIPASTSGGASGNITPLGWLFSSSSRRFVTPGTYHWTAEIVSGAPSLVGKTITGTIKVL